MTDTGPEAKKLCKNCWKRIKQNAIKCPSCGKAPDGSDLVKPIIVVLALLVVAGLGVGIFGLINNSTKESKKSNLPAAILLNQAEDQFSHRDILAARDSFEQALEQANSETTSSLPPLRLANANHELGHCLDYLWQGDHGEKAFASANTIYKQVNWPATPVLGLGREGMKMLDDITKDGPEESMRKLRNNDKVDWAVILTTNLDWAEALYRNKHYDEAIVAFSKFMQYQNEYRLVAMCGMSNKVNGTYLGHPSDQQLIRSCLQIFDSNTVKGSALLSRSFKTIGDCKLFGSHAFPWGIHIVHQQVENYFLSGQNEKALALLATEEEPLKAWATKSDRDEDLYYAKNYLAMLEHMKSATSLTKPYASINAPGSPEADIAETDFWSKQYDKAIENYLKLFTQYPGFETDAQMQSNKPDGIIGAPVAQHLIYSCLQIFDKDNNKGVNALEKAWGVLAVSAVSNRGDFWLNQIETRAEDYYYAGHFKPAKALFELEIQLATAKALQGTMQHYKAYADAYLSKIDRREHITLHF